MLMQFIFNGLCAGSLFAIMALGFSIIYSVGKVFHFAHGAVYTSAVYLLFLFNVSLKINLLGSLLLALGFAVFMGIIMDYFFYQPLSARKSYSTAGILTSLGIYIFIINLIALIFGNETKILRPGIEKTFQMGTVILTQIQLFQILTFAVFLAITVLALKFTKYGHSIRAVSENEKLAKALGFDIKKIRYIAFGYGSFLAGVAACLAGLDVGIDPHIGLTAVLTATVAMIVGGIGIIPAAAFGGILIGLIQNLAVWQISARWQSAITFFILLIILIFRPQGIIAGKKRMV